MKDFIKKIQFKMGDYKDYRKINRVNKQASKLMKMLEKEGSQKYSLETEDGRMKLQWTKKDQLHLEKSTWLLNFRTSNISYDEGGDDHDEYHPYSHKCQCFDVVDIQYDKEISDTYGNKEKA